MSSRTTGSRTCGSTESSETESEESFWKMQQLNQMTDAILEAEDGFRISVHRVILAASSHFFRALFRSNTSENPLKPIKLQMVPSKVLETIIKFAYRCPIEINRENVGDLLLWSDYLDVSRLAKNCETFVRKNIDRDSWLDVWKYASICNKTLAGSVLTFLAQNFKIFKDREHEKIFSHLGIEDICKVLQSDDLNVNSEMDVWSAAKTWIEEKPEERRPLASEALGSVRVKCLTEKELSKVLDSLLIQEGTPLADRVGTVLKLNHNMRVRNDELLRILEAKACRPRLPTDVLLAIGGWSGASPTRILESYDTQTQRWTPLPFNDPMGPRAYHGLAVLHSNIFMVGGFNGQSYFSSLRSFNTTTKKWRERGPMYHKRCYVSTATVDGKIFVMGGHNGRFRMSSCEYYDPQENQWTLITPMHSRRSDAHATALHNRIYICGGFDGHSCMSTVECYDWSENRWSVLSREMERRRSGAGVVELDGAIYAIGGFDGSRRLNSVERYDPRSNSWQSLAPMISQRSNFGIETSDGKIFVAGGYDGTGTTNESECFEKRMNAWRSCGKMSLNRSALYMCKVERPRNIYDYLGSRDIILPHSNTPHSSTLPGA